jgi:phosphatidylserine/phosphatidylglycerophosphate/cardiolipin synthase-like enzyme
VSGPGLPDSDLGRWTRSLPPSLKVKLTELIAAGELDLTSTVELRESLTLGTPEASAISAEYRQLAEQYGPDVARGVLLGVCSVHMTDVRPQLVWTAPGAPAAARRTAQVVADVVASAQRSVVVVGYSMTKAAAPLVGVVAGVARRGITCSFVADRMEEKLKTLVDLWPADLGLPSLWTRPADPNDQQSALHAKFIVVDRHRLLITSANLTYHGFHGNIELGVLLEGPVAGEAEQLVREWIKAGLIRQVGA